MIALRRSPVAVLLVLLSLFGASCALNADEGPRLIADDNVPFGLLESETSTTSTTSTTVPPIGTRTIKVFFIREARLVGVPRDLAVPVSVEDAVLALLDGPSEDEANKALRSAIPAGTKLLVTARSGQGTVIDLTGAFGDIQGEDQILAVAQLVFTATEISGVRFVTFRIDGKPIDVPRGDGRIESGPLARINFEQQAPVTSKPPPTTTTTAPA